MIAGRRQRLREIATSALVLATLTAAASVHAQQAEDPAVLATARGVAVEGMKLARAGRCAEAIDKLERAEQLHHSPVVLGQLAACHIEQGRLIQGTEMLRALLREPLPEESTPAVRGAYQRADALLAATRPRIASLTLLIDAPGAIVPSVKLDGHDVPVALLGVARAIDPGEHTIEASAPGCASVTQRLTLQAGQARALPIYLQAVGPVAVTAPLAADPGVQADAASDVRPSTVARSAAARPDPVNARPPWPAYVAWGVSAVSLGVGIAFGWAALDDKAELDAKCPGGVCPPEHQATLDAAKRRGVISSVAFGIGAAGAVTGAVLYFTSRSGPAEARASAATTVRVGLARAELGIAF
jgi:hypothetical protein